MGTLTDFSNYILHNVTILSRVETVLLDRQKIYENLFQEVQTVREHEFQQAIAEISKYRGSLPYNIDQRLNEATTQATEEFHARLQDLRDKHASVMTEAQKLQNQSIELENSLRTTNVDLDNKEETLKARNEVLLQQIRDYNERIKQLGSGFGFFLNLFDMRTLQQERLRLDKEQQDIVAHIHSLRTQWETGQKDYWKQQTDLRTKWLNMKTDADALLAKIDLLTNTRETVVERTAIERVVFETFPINQQQGTKSVSCPRCNATNYDSYSFCSCCALRLKPDRADLVGSLPEMAELQFHYKSFSEGMQACQELIGLVGGLISGLKAFHKSIISMIDTEKKYPVSKLHIEIPKESIAFSSQFEHLCQLVDTHAPHPLQLAKLAKQATAQFDKEHLNTYFNTMGDRLSQCADKQWN